jgi:hypothetical protein
MESWSTEVVQGTITPSLHHPFPIDPFSKNRGIDMEQVCELKRCRFADRALSREHFGKTGFLYRSLPADLCRGLAMPRV